MSSDPVLRIENLSVSFDTDAGVVRAVRGFDLTVGRGEIMGIVGESGSGKSTVALAIAHILAANTLWTCDAFQLAGRDVANCSPREWRSIRARSIGFVFQDPSSFLNPTMRVGAQIGERLLGLNLPRRTAAERVHSLLTEVGIADPDLADAYPHQLSGGMQQRVMIAMALAGDPALLLADEPTTALDVTTQAQILQLIDRLAKERGMATVLISHDLGVAASVCDRVTVMYAGEAVEAAPVYDLFAQPRMPYTEALLGSLPEYGQLHGARLPVIGGTPPDLAAPIDGCAFAARCAYVRDVCRGSHPPLSVRGVDSRLARCFATDRDGWWPSRE